MRPVNWTYNFKVMRKSALGGLLTILLLELSITVSAAVPNPGAVGMEPCAMKWATLKLMPKSSCAPLRGHRVHTAKRATGGKLHFCKFGQAATFVRVGLQIEAAHDPPGFALGKMPAPSAAEEM
jgi:hypothetical protein